jgi:hypothetical protein
MAGIPPCKTEGKHMCKKSGRLSIIPHQDGTIHDSDSVGDRIIPTETDDQPDTSHDLDRRHDDWSDRPPLDEIILR